VPYTTGLPSFTFKTAAHADSTSWSFGVRAYNSTAEEQNTSTITVTADAAGPAPVSNLTGIAVP
jgi:hypothetical protein